MKKLFVILLALFAISGFSTVVRADGIDFKSYLALKADSSTKDLLELYVGGMGSGIQIANIAHSDKGRKKLYCVPSELAVTSPQYVSILDRFLLRNEEKISKLVKEDPTILDKNILPVFLLQGLIDTFPCDK